MNDSDQLHDVAIVGFGPTGAVAAGLLGAHGLRTFVCDRSREIYDLPRAIALDHEIMRVFQQLGVVEAITPYLEPFTDSCYYGVDGQLIRRMSTVAPPYPLGYTPSIVFTQPPVEKILREHAQGLPSVEVELGTELIGLEQDAAGVTLRLRDDRGEGRSVRARYVIACDGAASTVRGLVGITLEDLGFDEPWLVVDVRVNEEGLARLPKESVQYCEPQRPASYIIGPGNHRRWEISINAGEDPQQLVTPEGTWKLLSRWITPADATLWRQASYRFHALVAGNWRSGRVFVAGDCAHQQPPFLGQGMCQGVRDVANLGWKLAAVLAGQAGDAMLDTYGTERRGHVTELTTRIKHVGLLIGERDVARARERDARLLAECGGVVKPVPRQNVQPPLTSGLLSPRPHAANGTLFPQPWLSGEGQRQRMDARFGCGWRLVMKTGAAQDMVVVPVTLPMPITVVQLGQGGIAEIDGVLENWFGVQQCSAALVRPDHYVYGVAIDAQELAGLFTALNRQLAIGD
jgi:3-(3-hydroxy-phenyl)propionate hydroxylase